MYHTEKRQEVRQRVAAGQGRPGAWTVQLEAKAMGKLYGISPDDENYFKPPKRNREDIKRSRGDRVRDRHFSKTNNDELVKFCKGTGLRRSELAELRGKDLVPRAEIEGDMGDSHVGLLARLFCASTFAVENPGYPRTAQVLRNNGVRTVFVPVDGDGMTLDALQAGGAQLAYVTPSHQFPTGATMPIARRTELLRWAGAAPGRYVVEDDYDSEFRYDTRPIPSLQGLDQAGRVIYVSTFSKSMAPSMRIGYMVLPVPVLEMYRAEYGVYSSTVSRFEQQTLCRFMEEGHFARHLNRLRSACRARRDALLEALYAAFGRDGVAVRGSHTGLHLLAAVHNGMTERELVEAAARAGVHVNGLSAYYMEHPEDCPPATVVLGYSDMDERALRAAVDALRCAWGARPSE